MEGRLRKVAGKNCRDSRKVGTGIHESKNMRNGNCGMEGSRNRGGGHGDRIQRGQNKEEGRQEIGIAKYYGIITKEK